MQAKVMIARFPGKYIEHPASTDWASDTIRKAKADPRISQVYSFWRADTPITMTRNQAVREALELGVDVLVQVDSDMEPDCEPDGKPFWETAFDFWWQRRHAPMVIGAPYVGPPPRNNIYVFHWESHNNFDSTAFHLPQYSRDHAAMMTGVGKVAALPTGVIFYGNLGQCMKLRPDDPGPGLPPLKDKGWYYYEYTDETCSEKASTEDVTNTRDIGFLLATSGIPDAGIYCTWDCWAGHIKPQTQRKPRRLVSEDVGETLKNAWRGQQSADERRVQINLKPLNLPEKPPELNFRDPRQRDDDLIRIGGMFTPKCDLDAIEMLARKAMKSTRVPFDEYHRAIEVGSWVGESTLAIARGFSDKVIIECIDTWHGTASDATGAIAAEVGGDYVYETFLKNTTPILGSRYAYRTTSEKASKQFGTDPFAHFLLIDADHSFESVALDIALWASLVVDSGITVFHDYGPPDFPGVKQAVDEAFGEENVTHIPNTAVAYVVMTPAIRERLKKPEEVAV